jgi:hypothetical protein
MGQPIFSSDTTALESGAVTIDGPIGCHKLMRLTKNKSRPAIGQERESASQDVAAHSSQNLLATNLHLAAKLLILVKENARSGLNIMAK